MFVQLGGGLVEEGEVIEIVELPMLEAKVISYDPNSPLVPTNCYFGLLYGFLWFFCNKADKFSSEISS